MWAVCGVCEVWSVGCAAGVDALDGRGGEETHSGCSGRAVSGFASSEAMDVGVILRRVGAIVSGVVDVQSSCRDSASRRRVSGAVRAHVHGSRSIFEITSASKAQVQAHRRHRHHPSRLLCFSSIKLLSPITAHSILTWFGSHKPCCAVMPP
jgi:hypothetical protein